VRAFALAVLAVLVGGILLLVAPETILARWPWRLGPFSARFLGAIYAAEFVALSFLVLRNRWSPGRLMLAMALVFTLTVTLVSLFHLDAFNFRRRGPWGWFILYGGSALIAAALLWQHRALRHPGIRPSQPWRLLFLFQAGILGGYGSLMLAAPHVATEFWPWPADPLSGRVYSGMFFAAGFGAFMISRSASVEDYLAFGMTQACLGAASLVSFYVAEHAAPASEWETVPAASTPWIISCCSVFAMGLLALAAAWEQRKRTPDGGDCYPSSSSRPSELGQGT
jgi:hypothetical protein